jgi:hypothetical protein
MGAEFVPKPARGEREAEFKMIIKAFQFKRMCK